MTRFMPLVVFGLLVGFLAYGLQRDPSRIESPLIDQAAPEFSLPILATGETFDSNSMRGQVWVLNVFASWCAACVTEHPLLVQLANDQSVPLVGLNYKDQTSDAVAWLNRFGNPFVAVAEDQAGGVGIDWGVYGVPETFVIDANGEVRYKHIGPLTDESIANTVVPLIQSLENQAVSSR